MNDTTIKLEGYVWDVLENLPGEWTYTAKHDWYVVGFRQSDGLAIGFSLDRTYAAKPGRVNVGYAVDDWDLVYRSDDRPEIGVNITTRSAAAVAGDVQRRLLEDAERFHRVIVERTAERKRFAGGVERTRETCEKALGAPLELDHNRRSRIGGKLADGSTWYGDISVADTTVSLDLGPLPTDVAAMILRIVHNA